MDRKNLKIIGTSHIAKQSLDDVEKSVEAERPDIIALELDRSRLHGLFKKPGKLRIYDIKRVGIKGFLFSLIGAWAEKKMGDIVGVAPGSEMKSAVNLARKNKIQIALIDQDIEITLRRFSKTITWKEKWNFVVDLFKGFFVKGNVIEFDLSKRPNKKTIKPKIYLEDITENQII